MKILITGVPAAGKTTLSKKLKDLFNFENIDISRFILDNKLYDEYNEELDTYDFNEDIIRSKIERMFNNSDNIIIDTHSPIISQDLKFDLILHLFADSDTLESRYLERGYSLLKCTENLDAYELDLIGDDLEEFFEGVDIYKVYTGNKNKDEYKPENSDDENYCVEKIYLVDEITEIVSQKMKIF